MINFKKYLTLKYMLRSLLIVWILISSTAKNMQMYDFFTWIIPINFFIFCHFLILFAKSLRKNNKAYFWSLFIVIFICIPGKSKILGQKNISDLKKLAIEIQKDCQIYSNCKLGENAKKPEPWTKGRVKVCIKENEFRITYVEMETERDIYGGVKKNLFFELNFWDHPGSGYHQYTYQNEKWELTNKTKKSVLPYSSVIKPCEKETKDKLNKKEKKTEQEIYQEKLKENEIDQMGLVYSPLYSWHKRKLNESSHNLKYTFKKNKLNLNLSDTEHRELVLKFFFYDECKGGQKQIDKLTKTLEGVTIDPVALRFAYACQVVLNNNIREKFKTVNKTAKSDEEHFKEILKINFHDALNHYYWYEVEELK